MERSISFRISRSFLNVVVYRLPIMLYQSWREQCADLLKQKSPETRKVNLFVPRSHCPNCKRTISMWVNIPVLSYIFLRGKCLYCHHKISWRYPLIELSSGVLSVLVALHYGWHLQTVFALLLTWGLIALVFIDLEHQLLPDELTLNLLWLGLMISVWQIFLTPRDAIIGAAVGYVSLWLIGWFFKIIRGVEGIGYGDYKLFAVFGAWVGWQMLPFVIFLASLAAALVGLTLIVTKKIRRNTPVPFGPYLAIAGWLTLLYGQTIAQFYWRLF